MKFFLFGFWFFLFKFKEYKYIKSLLQKFKFLQIRFGCGLEDTKIFSFFKINNIEKGLFLLKRF